MQTRVPKTVSAGATRTPVAPASQESAWQPQVFQSLLHSGVIQAKLTVSQPGDPLEQEADQVADEVMRMPNPSPDLSDADPGIQRKCSCSEGGGHVCDKCSKEEETKLQAKEAPGYTPSMTPQAEAHVESLRGGGQPMPSAVRSFFEPRFGRDFSGVRIHSDSRANEAASAVQARAFTLGRDIVFGAGQYAPQTTEGQRLLAHELAHVGQQGQAGRVCRQAAPAQDHTKAEQQYQQCDNLQACKAATRWKLANTLTGKAIEALQEPEKVSNLLLSQFHTTPQGEIGTIRKRFQGIRAVLNTPVQFICESGSSAACRKDGKPAGAFVSGGGKEVHLCSDFFGIYQCPGQVQTMIHEAAHLLPEITEDIYAGDGDYKTLAPSQAIKNPDSYAMFALGIASNQLHCDPCKNSKPQPKKNKKITQAPEPAVALTAQSNQAIQRQAHADAGQEDSCARENVPSCSPGQLSYIRQAERQAKGMIDSAITAVRTLLSSIPPSSDGPLRQTFQKHFHTSPSTSAPLILDTYALLRSDLGASGYRCYSRGSRCCDKPEEPAMTGEKGTPIDLCPGLFSFLGCQAPNILIHESGHHVPGMFDIAYEGTSAYARLEENALINPDSYAQFAADVHGPVSCQVYDDSETRKGTNTSATTRKSPPAIQRKCSEEEETKLQSKEAPGLTPSITPQAGEPSIQRQAYREDSKGCGLTAKYTITFAFLPRKHDLWTPQREDNFMAAAKSQIEGAFNRNEYRIVPAGANYQRSLFGIGLGLLGDCPCFPAGFRPKVEITTERGLISSRSGDWNTRVTANASGEFIQSAAAEGAKELGELDEADVKPRRAQTPIVHEFGHFLGLQHPGHGIPGVTSEYAYSGLDSANRQVAGTDLLGGGMGLRPFYFDRWVAHLNSSHSKCRYAISE